MHIEQKAINEYFLNQKPPTGREFSLKELKMIYVLILGD